MAAHRMGQHDDRPRGIGKDDPLQEPVEIAQIGVIALDMALVGIVERPVGAALAPPVEGEDGEAPGQQVVGGLAIFLDELGPPLQQQHRAARAAGRARPARGAVPSPATSVASRGAGAPPTAQAFADGASTPLTGTRPAGARPAILTVTGSGLRPWSSKRSLRRFAAITRRPPT